MDCICSECSTAFSRRDSLLRHRKNIHAGETVFDLDSPMKFRHPFTKIVAGPTGCGKTTYVDSLIDRAEQFIDPPPQRIIWFFKQWQPLYAEIKRKHPHVEFIMGVSADLMSPEYFDVNTRNLVVIDDLMADLNKAVTLLYTAGSHHSNLSVITLQQNIFPTNGECRTMSLNSHYLVLFKNPRDQRQVSVLASQMYPTKTHVLLNIYRKATAKPFGYLVIDLKQETAENERLKPNALQSSQPQEPMENMSTKSECHSASCPPELQPSQLANPPTNVPHCEDCGTVMVSSQHADLHAKFCKLRDIELNHPNVEDLKENYTFSMFKRK